MHELSDGRAGELLELMEQASSDQAFRASLEDEFKTLLGKLPDEDLRKGVAAEMPLDEILAEAIALVRGKLRRPEAA